VARVGGAGEVAAIHQRQEIVEPGEFHRPIFVTESSSRLAGRFSAAYAEPA
jgi:hypothetical protein